MKLYQILGLTLILIGLQGCTWIDQRQRAAIYRPSQVTAQEFPGLQAHDRVLYLPLNSVNAQEQPPEIGTEFIAAWWLPSSKPDTPTLLYFHGVFRNLSDNYPKLQALREAGFSVLAVSYRGWPQSSPLLPSEQTLYADAKRAWVEFQKLQPIAAKRGIYGHSMGGAVAVDLASQLRGGKDYAALLLESTFTSGTDLMTSLRWYGFLLTPLATQQFDSWHKITHVDAPILIRHGVHDTTIPFLVGKRLFDAAHAPKQFVPFEAGNHSDLHTTDPTLYQSSLQDFWRSLVQ